MGRLKPPLISVGGILYETIRIFYKLKRLAGVVVGLGKYDIRKGSHISALLISPCFPDGLPIHRANLNRP